jgi:lipopolysaccharide biosynthesis glycosyltransferase
MESLMNVCFVVNRAYIGQLKVAIYSLSKYNQKVNIIVLTHDLTQEDKSDLSRFAEELSHNIRFIDMSDELFIGLPRMGYDKSYTAYFKLMIPYALSDLEKVLYLDCDLLVEKSLDELYNKNTNHFMSACLDEKVNKKRIEHIKLITGETKNYFNSGVILFDFKHQDEIVNQDVLFDYIKSNKEIFKFHDQDILNHFYINKCDHLEEKYNYVTTYKSIKDIFIHQGGKDAVVIHYANWKPWNNNYIGKYYKKYLKTYKILKKNEKLNFLKRRNIFSMLKLILKYIVR